MQSKESQQRIEVLKRVNVGAIPLFIQLAHKGLEKSMPVGESGEGGTKFVVATDLLALSVSKPEILEGLDRVEVVYAKGW